MSRVQALMRVSKRLHAKQQTAEILANLQQGAGGIKDLATAGSMAQPAAA